MSAGAFPDPEKMKAELAKLPPPEMKDAEVQMRFSDYAKSGGVAFPKLITWTLEGTTSEEFEVAKYVVNPNLKPEKFRK